MVVISWQHRAVSYILTPKEQEIEASFVIPMQSRALRAEILGQCALWQFRAVLEQ